MTGPLGLHYERYDADGSSEWLMRIGPREAPAILFLPALFEEMNRTRALVAAIMRSVARQGYGCWLIDLPGTGESERALDACDWTDWRNAVTAGARHVSAQGVQLRALAAIRGACLLDDAVETECRWRFAPVEGASLARDLSRAGLMGGGSSAGYALAPSLLASLEGAKAVPGKQTRIIRLASDRGDADLTVEGPALWRRSEPGNSPELAARLAGDIEQWLGPCAVS